MLPTHCPHCTAPQQDDLGRRTIGFQVKGLYDDVLFWVCPDCFGVWSPWPESDSRHQLATSWIKKYTEKEGTV